MPRELVDLAATGAVIYIVLRFLAELRAMGESRDAERKAFLEALTSQGEQFAQATTALVDLARSMVDRCQSRVSSADRVTGDDVIQAAKGVGRDRSQ